MKRKLLAIVPLYFLASPTACGISKIPFGSDDSIAGAPSDDADPSGGRTTTSSGGAPNRNTGGTANQPSGGASNRNTGGTVNQPSGGSRSVGGSSDGGAIVWDGGGSPIGGEGGVSSVLETQGEVLHENSQPITSLSSNDSHVYFLEYGTEDELENYQNDGKLFRLPVGGGSPELVASDLHAPVQISLTDVSAYVVLDRSVHFDSSGRQELWKVPLSGGQPEFVRTIRHRKVTEFRSWGSVAYWRDATGIYRDGVGGIATIYSGQTYAFDVDESDLYVVNYGATDDVDNEGLIRYSLSTDLRSMLSRGYYGYVAVIGDTVLGTVNTYENSYIRYMPKAGGLFQNVVRVPGRAYNLWREGEDYVYPTSEGLVVRTLDGKERYSLELGEEPSRPLFDVSADSLFMAEGNKVFKISLD